MKEMSWKEKIHKQTQELEKREAKQRRNLPVSEQRVKSNKRRNYDEYPSAKYTEE